MEGQLMHVRCVTIELQFAIIPELVGTARSESLREGMRDVRPFERIPTFPHVAIIWA